MFLLNISRSKGFLYFCDSLSSLLFLIDLFNKNGVASSWLRTARKDLISKPSSKMGSRSSTSQPPPLTAPPPHLSLRFIIIFQILISIMNSLRARPLDTTGTCAAVQGRDGKVIIIKETKRLSSPSWFSMRTFLPLLNARKVHFNGLNTKLTQTNKFKIIIDLINLWFYDNMNLPFWSFTLRRHLILYRKLWKWIRNMCVWLLTSFF